jgi:hypothetical protein
VFHAIGIDSKEHVAALEDVERVAEPVTRFRVFVILVKTSSSLPL